MAFQRKKLRRVKNWSKKGVKNCKKWPKSDPWPGQILQVGQNLTLTGPGSGPDLQVDPMLLVVASIDLLNYRKRPHLQDPRLAQSTHSAVLEGS